jgi:hypothetical protein
MGRTNVMLQTMLESLMIRTSAMLDLFKTWVVKPAGMMTAVQYTCVEKSTTVVRVCLHQYNQCSCHVTLVRNCQEQQHSLLCASYNLICVWMNCH